VTSSPVSNPRLIWGLPSVRTADSRSQRSDKVEPNLFVRSGNVQALAVCLFAVLLVSGAFLRFSNLGQESEMSSDEGADWAAASAPTLAEVEGLGVALNPGKLAIYDVALHFWIQVFGDSVTSMRALSAALGVLDVLLLFVVVREIFGGWSAVPNPRLPTNPNAVALLGALIMALNVTMVKYSRELRMYSLVLALILIQVWWFFRLVRKSHIEDYANLALLTALALAANFTASLVFAAEGVWLLPSLLGLPRRSLMRQRRAWLIVATLGAGCAVFLLPLGYEGTLLVGRVKQGEFGWIQPTTIWGVVHLLWDATGRLTFAVIAPLAVCGSLRGWRRAPYAASFLILWFCVPILLATFVSYILTPFLVERYVLSSFLPFFVLAGLGILELRRPTIIFGALALVVTLELCDVHYYDRSKSDLQWGVQWSEAVAAAVATRSSVGVEPPVAHNVVQYYLRHSPLPPQTYQNNFVGGRDADVLIVTDQIPIDQPRAAAILFSEYSKTVARFKGVAVIGR